MDSDSKQEKVEPEIWSGWDEHEDYLVGNKKGLELLKQAIDEAIQNGEVNRKLGAFLGLKCFNDEFFLSDEDELDDGWSGFTFFIVLLSILAVFIIGLITIGQWIYSLI